MHDGRPRAPQAAVGASGDVLFEITIIGPAARCAAIDAATGFEVVVTGPASAAETHLKTLALKKLRLRLRLERP